MPGPGRRFQKGQVANPNGRPKTTLQTILKDQKQRDFLNVFYPLLGLDKANLIEKAKDPTITAIEATAVRIIVDAINGKPHTLKLYLGLLGFDVRDPQLSLHIARYVVTDDGKPPAGEIDATETSTENVHAQVVSMIKDISSRNAKKE